MALLSIFKSQKGSRRNSNQRPAGLVENLKLDCKNCKFCKNCKKYCKIDFAKRKSLIVRTKNVERFTILRVILAQGPC